MQPIIKRVFQEIIDFEKYPFTNIEIAYKNRAYHNLEHIQYCISAFFKHKEKLAITDEKSLLCAILFHDFYMQTGNDEEKSAQLGFEVAQKYGKGINPETVKRLILATKHDEEKNLQNDEIIIHDLDLLILGDKGKYNNYAKNVRGEYAHIPDKLFNKGRCDFLTSMIKKDQIFIHPHFQNNYEKQAKINMNNELALLKTAISRVIKK